MFLLYLVFARPPSKTPDGLDRHRNSQSTAHGKILVRNSRFYRKVRKNREDHNYLIHMFK